MNALELCGFVLCLVIHVGAAFVFAAVMIRKEPRDTHDDGHCSGHNVPGAFFCPGTGRTPHGQTPARLNEKAGAL